ncbi:hypothetical protein BDV06DRAFT_72665 [Aspergillus oleicola]
MNTPRPFELLAGAATVIAPVSFGYFFWTGRSPTSAAKFDQRTMAALSSSISKVSSGGWSWGKNAISTSRSALSHVDVKNMSLETIVLEPTARFSASLARETPKRGPWYGNTWFLMVLSIVALVGMLWVAWVKVGSQMVERINNRIPKPVNKAYALAIEKVVHPVINSGPVQKTLAPVKRPLNPVLKVFISIRQSPQTAKKVLFTWAQKGIQDSTPATAKAQAPDLNASLQRQLDQMKATTKEMQRNYDAMLKNNDEMAKLVKKLDSRVEGCEGWQRTVELGGTFGGPRRALN